MVIYPCWGIDNLSSFAWASTGMHAGALASRSSATAIQSRIRGGNHQHGTAALSITRSSNRSQQQQQSVTTWTGHRPRVSTHSVVCKASGGLLGGLKKAFKGTNKPRIDEDLVEFPPYKYDTPQCQQANMMLVASAYRTTLHAHCCLLIESRLSLQANVKHRRSCLMHICLLTTIKLSMHACAGYYKGQKIMTYAYTMCTHLWPLLTSGETKGTLPWGLIWKAAILRLLGWTWLSRLWCVMSQQLWASSAYSC